MLLFSMMSSAEGLMKLLGENHSTLLVEHGHLIGRPLLYFRQSRWISPKTQTPILLSLYIHSLIKALYCPAPYDLKSWWMTKFSLIMKQLSNYEIIDADNDEPDVIHCFPRPIVELSYHKELGIDPAKTPTGYSIMEFKEALRKAYGQEQARVMPRGDQWDI
ncbi:hypothetical protein Cni_G02998 [Canna indica]|uniref:Uncharacterized protein n=1 Tax=Canna indica TaxID=4628 RepID=A0AAQ3JQJ8_9LILI|nr:hypothetical protein Cni_G02998 [Canna indica]